MQGALRKLKDALGLASPSTDKNQIYDRLTVDIIRKVLADGGRAIDIGCNRGLILEEILAASPSGAHIAFEPIPSLASALRKRFPTVDIVEAAVSSQPGHAKFNYVVNDDAYSGLRERTYDRPDPKIEPIDVKVTTLSDHVPVGDHVRFIKIDIEGGEYDALLGGRELIATNRPIIVFEAGYKSSSHYGAGPENFEAFFDSIGYALFTLEAWLEDRAPIPPGQFGDAWEEDYYFLATPR